MSLSLTPEQKRTRASSGGHGRAANNSPERLSEIAGQGQRGLIARFRREAEERWPGLSDAEYDRRSSQLLKSHMQKLALASSRARKAAADG